jgi:hypothetical protein
MEQMNAVVEVTNALMITGAKKATKYLSPKDVVKATRFGKPTRGKTMTFFVTIGRPNYAERAFIKTAKRAGERFPVKRVQLKFDPKRK